MGYGDFWFIDKRVQTKNLKRWFLYGILLFAFVTVGVIVGIKSMYQPFNSYLVSNDVITIKVDEAKKTNVNGYVKGSISNISDSEVNGKYIKFIFLSKNDENIGSEYIEIGTLKPQETKTYEEKFRYQNIDKLIITISDSKE